MSDYTELKRLAEAANAVTSDVNVTMAVGTTSDEVKAVQDYLQLSMPRTILALIDENERKDDRIKHVEQQFYDMQIERDQLKAENEALRKTSEAYRLLSFCHGQGTLGLVQSHRELCIEVRRLKILAGEPVPPAPEEFVGPRPEGPTARLRRKLATMGKGERS